LRYLAAPRPGYRDGPCWCHLVLLLQAGTAIMFPIPVRVKSVQGWSSYQYWLDVRHFGQSGIRGTI